MKAMFRAGSLVVALAVVIGAGRLFAEGKEQKPAKEAKPQTRIAILNLTYVIKNYEKYKNFQDEITETIDPFQKRDQKLRGQLEKLRVQSEKIKKEREESPLIPAKAEDLEEKVKKIQRELEDNSQKTKKTLGKKSDDEMKILFKDVAEAARRYAVAHDIDLVLHYNDATKQEDFMSPQNIARKLNTGALVPVYYAAGVDISIELTDLLNKGMHKN